MKRIRLVSLIAVGASCLFLADPGLTGGGGRGGRRRAGGRRRRRRAAGGGGGAGGRCRPAVPMAAEAAALALRTVLPAASSARAAGRPRLAPLAARIPRKEGTSIDYAGAGTESHGAGWRDGRARRRRRSGHHAERTGKYTKVGAGRGAVGPNGNAVGQKGVRRRRRRDRTGRPPRRNRGGVGRRAERRRRGRQVQSAPRRGRRGTVAGASRGAVATGPNGLAAYSQRGVTTGHRTAYVATGALRTQGAYVRQSFVHYNAFGRNWYAAHPHAWRAAAWTAAAFWAGATWATVSSSCGYPSEPVVYDYGTTIVYQDNEVYYNGEPGRHGRAVYGAGGRHRRPRPAGATEREGGMDLAGRLRHGQGRGNRGQPDLPTRH